jgi:hypothetical protein
MENLKKMKTHKLIKIVLNTLEENIKARIAEKAIRVVTNNSMDKMFFKAVGTKELYKIIEEEFAKIKEEM